MGRGPVASPYQGMDSDRLGWTLTSCVRCVRGCVPFYRRVVDDASFEVWYSISRASPGGGVSLSACSVQLLALVKAPCWHMAPLVYHGVFVT